MKTEVNIKDLEKALRAISFGAGDLLQLEGAGAFTLVNGMRRRVPVDTSATQNSIKSHVVSATAQQVVDDVGPETAYAPYIEYGVHSKPNYPIQPFVRPTAQQDFEKVLRAIGVAFGAMLVARWPK
jgi:hypothetical protein